MSDYYRQKAIRAKELFDRGLPFVKVYAPVRDGDKFIVLEKHRDGKTFYDIAGGGVDENENLEDALKRELAEELHVDVEIVKHLGMYNEMFRDWELDGEKFSIRYEIHVFDVKLVKKKGGKLGLKGEFNSDVKIAKIDKETLLASVPEFRDFGFKID